MGTIGLILGIAIVAVVLVLFLRRSRSVFAERGTEGTVTERGGVADANRFDIVQIPADEAGAREYILRDDKTGARIQVMTVFTRARVVQVVIPKKHLGQGVEFELFQAVAANLPDVENWTWPQMTVEGRDALARYVRENPGVVFYDSNGLQIR
ncbi:hypothetical protein D9V32_03660 [Mycetocola tolaasinivorans]|uniref:Uncharacterized protein n=1 Tax=Mycetocola tolaasinivorans TaxID=76635 RepID=A0A3L7AAY6_9MICO|nr:hypothetical protein [Mycetocola tolaasinivorans]RLP77549.1 hypothetical protein D9V32_03660 [Mycetocola tolaasinivorans]